MKYGNTTLGCVGNFKESKQYSNSNYDLPNICLLVDNEVKFGASEERFSKVKNDSRSVSMALENMMQMVFNRSPYDIKTIIDNIDPEICEIDTELKGDIQHHLTHAYSAFYTSGFVDSLVFVCDGYGSDIVDGQEVCASMSMYFFQIGQRPILIKQFDKEESICIPYREFANLCFDTPEVDLVRGRRSFHEGKLMGLSAYGKDLGWRVANFENGKVHVDYKILEKMRSSTISLSLFEKADIATTIQKNFEEIFLIVLKYCVELAKQQGYTSKNLCLSGGGILNCPTNDLVCKSNLFKHYWATPDPADSGNSIGKAYYLKEQVDGVVLPNKLLHPYLGCCYGDEYLSDTEGLQKIEGTIENFLYSLLSQDDIVVLWFDGGAEFSPRALGHRSMLGNPSRKTMHQMLNIIKDREQWRPIAPIVPDVLMDEIFENVENKDLFDFMLRTAIIKEEWRSKIPAVCHWDNSTRPQILRKKTNPTIYNTIMRLWKEQRIPCICNTSLNLGGYPMVETPYDAFEIMKVKGNEGIKMCLIFNQKYFISNFKIK